MIVGILGTGLGLGLGLTLLKYRNEFLDLLRKCTGFELFPREIYNFDLLPSQTNPRDLLIICGSAFLICALAGLFPAWSAARVQSAQALRDF
jgi:lipoprotein-releasing system permease protein